MQTGLHELFTQYKKNYRDWNELEKFLMKSNTRAEWFQDFYKTMISFQSIFDSNKMLIDEISEYVNDLNSENAQILYDELFSMYIEDYNDAEFLNFICDKLIIFYESSEEYSKLVYLYTISVCYNLMINNPENHPDEFDLKYLKKGMAMLKYYSQIDAGARYRIWIMYYDYIVRLADVSVVSIGDALDAYDEIIAFSELPDIKKLDSNEEAIHNIKNHLKQTVFISVGVINETDDATRLRFYGYTRKYFDEYSSPVASMYELPAELYACYLYNDYIEGILNFDEIFIKFSDYATYRFRRMMSKPDFDNNELIQSINAIRFMTRLGKFVSNKDLVSKSIKLLVNFIQNNWVKSNLSVYDRITDMLGKACMSLVSYDVVGINKEKCITQLVVQRDILVYIHSKITAEIALALYRELTTTNIDFFKDVKSIPPKQWVDYLYYSSMFHDIGMERVVGTFTCYNRPLFEEEVKRLKRHVQYGANAMDMVESTAKYSSVIRGHHVSFDGVNSEEYHYDRNNTDTNVFVDIVSLAVYIETATNPFWDFLNSCKKFPAVLKDIKAQKNTRFNGEIVDAILYSEALQKQIEKIVTVTREDIVFDVYHNWEKIHLSQDEESMLDESLEAYDEFRKTNDEKAFLSNVKQLEYLAENGSRDTIRSKAMYKLMMYKFIIGKYNEAIALSFEVEKLLKLTKNNELLAEYYYNIGNAEILKDNMEPALSGYLSCVSLARRTPGCKEIENMSLLSIASIFVAKFNFKKAKEYFDLCEAECLSIDEQIRYLCMKGYCHVRLGDISLVEAIKEKICSLIDKYPEYELFPQYVYLAMLSSELGDSKETEKYISIVNDFELKPEDVTYYFDEMFMYIELLSKKKYFKEASVLVDKYINLCGGRNECSSVLVKLINLKIEIMSYLKDIKEFIDYEFMLKSAYYVSCNEEATKIENVEKNLLKDIKLREEHDEALNNQEILEESVKEARNASEQKSQFLSSMSHEIRTPINAILGLNEMIMRESTEDSVLQYASDIQNAGKQLLGIINDVLDYSKIEAGKMEIVSERYNVSTLISDIKNMLDPKFKEKNLEFKVNANPEIPDVLFGDELRIKQILINLLSNAYKYTNAGSVTFNIDYNKVDESNISLKFDVIDTGIGLKKEQIEHIANPFERFDLEKNHSVEGTGLGMSIVMRLLEQMNSTLVIESEYGKGSTFSFEIKQGVIDWRKLGAAKENSVSNDSSKKKSGLLHAPNARVLIVDDNAVNLKVAKALLKRTDIQVTTANSGSECLNLCETNEYHVIMLDHMMPEMDGIETLHLLKQKGGYNSSVPTVALTANVVDSADNFYIKEGFDALLTKPINADKMEEMLIALLPKYLIE